MTVEAHFLSMVMALSNLILMGHLQDVRLDHADSISFLHALLGSLTRVCVFNSYIPCLFCLKTNFIVFMFLGCIRGLMYNFRFPLPIIVSESLFYAEGDFQLKERIFRGDHEALRGAAEVNEI